MTNQSSTPNQGQQSNPSTSSQDTRWYAEQFRNQIADRINQRFSNRSATAEELTSAIRELSVDELVQSVGTARAGSGSGSSGSSGSK